MKKSQFSFLVLVAFAALSAIPTNAQTCGEACGPLYALFLEVTGCGTSCQVGETITFTLEAEQDGLDVECEEDPIPELPECCTDDCATTETPSTVYYEGSKREIGSSTWVPDANCVSASNPLTYTFTSGDGGYEYRRKACTTSSCSTCSNTVTVTVTGP